MNNLEQHFCVFPQLNTQRLVLRKLEVSDAEEMFEYSSRPEASQYANWEPHTSVEYTKEFLRWLKWQYRFHKVKTWGITLKNGGKLIGTVSFVKIDKETTSAEIGYTVSSAFWGNGYATEAVQKLLEFGFLELGFQRIFAKVVKENVKSSRVLERLGFTYEGTLRNSMVIHKKLCDVSYYSILKSEFMAMYGE